MIQRFFTTTIGQILAIIASSSAVSFLLILLTLSFMHSGASPSLPWPWQVTVRVVSLVDSLRTAPDEQRAAVVAASRRPDMEIALTHTPIACDGYSADARNLETLLRSELPDISTRTTVHECSSFDGLDSIQVLIGVGELTLDIRTDKPVYSRWLTPPIISMMLFLCVAVTGMSTWAAWRVIRPLERLSAKADAFGREINVTPLEEEGPVEVRRAARAFNLMQERVSRSMSDRTRTLAAISHDLRTPLTRMRLQLQAEQSELKRANLLRDVDLMQSMVTSALAFLSGSFHGEEKEWLDLGALLSTLSDEYEDRGANVAYDGPQHMRFFCRPNAINRALTNLVDNAIHYGDIVNIVASETSDAIIIDVMDDGPGIPSDKVQEVIEPFVRLDPSRSNRPGSVGLGLSIVKEVVTAHFGTLELIQRPPKGLIARISFANQH
ncbi:MAG: two-component sensor histidine kinase [Rhizobium sp. 60-20]|jgi:signal transduction histidine kinase|nr:HAMP domain-containing protein [Rhizobium tropici]OJY73395.1 MAG: two-component sensor histidine kinase [Rhizobium sp. 60-20]RKD72380.1 signal transduction histidine kinase [Rhizobium sp. WW_1]